MSQNTVNWRLLQVQMYKFGLKKITNTTQYIEYQILKSTRNHNTLLYHEYCHENQTDTSTSGERELEEDLPRINHELMREPWALERTTTPWNLEDWFDS